MSRLPRFWRFVVTACWAVLGLGAAACGGSTSPSESAVVAVTLSDTSVALRVGDQAALVARARGVGGQELVGRPIFWSAHDTTVVSVSQSGVVQALRVGTTQIAASAEGQSGVATVTVLARPVATLQVDPATVQLVVNGRQQLTARALNDAGAPAAATVTWTSLNPSIVRVSSTGVVVGVSAGVGSVVATADSVTATAAVVVTPIPVASVTVTPSAPSIVVGMTQQLTASAADASGAPLVGRTASWTSRDPGTAVVSSTGQVTGIAPGTTSVVVTIEGQTATATVTVRPVPVAAVTVTPNSSSIGVGGTVRLGALVTDASGNALAGRTVTFTSSAPNIASVGTDGLVTGVAPGTATIQATSEGVTGSATVRVNAPAAASVASVQVAPATVTLTVGDTRVFTATAKASDGSTITGRPVTWSSGGPSVVTVSSSGVVTAVGAGTAQVLAQVDGITGTSTVTVQRVAVAAVSITPNPVTVPAGQVAQLAASTRDAAGNTLAGRVVTWASSNETVATVTSDGRVTGVSPGSATIRATSEGVTGSVPVTVSPVVRVAPATVTVRDRGNSNRTAQLVATDYTGRVLTSSEVTWSTSNALVALVDQNGLVYGVSSGSGTATAVITVTYRGVTATSTVTVSRN